MAKVLVLLHLHVSSKVTEEIAFVQYFEATPIWGAIDEFFKWLCIRWATDNETDCSASLCQGK